MNVYVILPHPYDYVFVILTWFERSCGFKLQISNTALAWSMSSTLHAPHKGFLWIGLFIGLPVNLLSSFISLIASIPVRHSTYLLKYIWWWLDVTLAVNTSVWAGQWLTMDKWCSQCCYSTIRHKSDITCLWSTLWSREYFTHQLWLSYWWKVCVYHSVFAILGFLCYDS